MSDKSAAPEITGGLRRKNPNWWRYTNASSLGIEIAVAIGVGWWVGHKIEQSYAEWRPWPSTLGFFVGCGAAVMAMRRVIREHRNHMAVLEAEAAASGEAGLHSQPEPSSGPEGPGSP